MAFSPQSHPLLKEPAQGWVPAPAIGREKCGVLLRQRITLIQRFATAHLVTEPHSRGLDIDCSVFLAGFTSPVNEGHKANLIHSLEVCRFPTLLAASKPTFHTQTIGQSRLGFTGLKPVPSHSESRRIASARQRSAASSLIRTPLK